jgi:hypothetical protein
MDWLIFSYTVSTPDRSIARFKKVSSGDLDGCSKQNETIASTPGLTEA